MVQCTYYIGPNCQIIIMKLGRWVRYPVLHLNVHIVYPLRGIMSPLTVQLLDGIQVQVTHLARRRKAGEILHFSCLDGRTPLSAQKGCNSGVQLQRHSVIVTHCQFVKDINFLRR